MPVSKRDWSNYLREEEESRGSYPRAEVGTLTVYSLTGFNGPCRVGLAHEVDDGYVTAVRHLDGSILELSRGGDIKRWVAADCNLTRPPNEILEEIGDIRADAKADIVEAVRPYFRNRDAG